MVNKIIMRLIIVVAFIGWTLACIYGTYDNTVQYASVAAVDGGYEITYGNTGEVHFYTD